MAINPFIGGSFGSYGYADRMRGMFGGDKSYIDPYTTGYHFMFFYLPSSLQSEYGSFLTTVCQSVQVPGIRVNNITYNGLNNMKWHVPGTVEYEGEEITCKFTEMAGLPIMQIMGQWVNIFRNILYGISDPDTSGSSSQGAYKGRALYATTLPDGITVQYAAVFTGIYPTKIPTDKYSSDRQSQEKVEADISFAFDQMLTGSSVISLATSQVSSTQSQAISTSDGIYNTEVS